MLLVRDAGLVKTIRFADPKYLGDPRNAVKIFNEKMVDELAILDIDATPQNRPPRFDFIAEIVSEAFMPVAYGGGIRTVEDATRMVALGVEKIIVGTHAVENPAFIRELASHLGSQSIVICLDIKTMERGGYEVRTWSGRRATGLNPVEFAREAEAQGAGEIILNAIDRDGTMEGYDLELVRSVSRAIRIPLIACGGAGSLADLRSAVVDGAASAAAAGSLFVFHGRRRSVLINYPERRQLQQLFSK